MAAWAPHLGSISHPHPGEEVCRLGHGLAARSFYRIRRTCIWLGDETNGKAIASGGENRRVQGRIGYP